MKAKCPVCKERAETYHGNNVTPPLGRRFRGHAKDGGPLLVNFRLTYCPGSYRLVDPST